MVISRGDPDLEAAHRILRVCFACREPLTDDHKIEWRGAAPDGGDAYIALHAGCAGKLALHLAKDALEADRRGGRRILAHGTKFPEP